MSGITEFTNSFDNKLETVVGESEIKLSWAEAKNCKLCGTYNINTRLSSLNNIIEKEIYKTKI